MIEVYKRPTGLAQYQEPKDFMKMSPMLANKALRHIRKEADIVLSALNKETPTIATLKKEFSEDDVISYVGIWIADLNMALGVKRIMTDEQIEECAMYVLDEFYHLTIADFKLFFTRLKAGTMGEFYESISMPKILNWLRDYNAERMTLFESAEDSRHYKSNEQRVREIKQTGSIKEISESLELRKKLGK